MRKHTAFTHAAICRIAMGAALVAFPARGQSIHGGYSMPTGTPATITTTSVGTTSTQLVPAAPGYWRLGAIVYNNTPAGGGVLYCRDDGAAAVSGMGYAIPPGNNTGYEWDYPEAGTAAITCICSTGTCTVGGAYVQ